MDTSDASRTLGRALSVLHVIAADSPEPKKLAEVTQCVGLPRATVYRLLNWLAAEGLIEATAAGYVIGSTCWSLGLAAERRFNIVDVVRPSLQRIADETHDVGLFSVRIGAFTRCTARVEGDYPVLPTSVRQGSVRPLGVGAHSLAQLAALDDEEISAVLAQTVTERARDYPTNTDGYLLAKVAETRRQGFAIAEGDIVAGWGGLALPVRDRWSKVIGAISFVAVSERLLPARRGFLLELLDEERRRIETALGKSDQPAPPSAISNEHREVELDVGP